MYGLHDRTKEILTFIANNPDMPRVEVAEHFDCSRQHVYFLYSSYYKKYGFPKLEKEIKAKNRAKKKNKSQRRAKK